MLRVVLNGCPWWPCCHTHTHPTPPFFFPLPQVEQLLSQVFTEPKAAGQLLFTPGLLWDAVKADAAATGESPEQYVERVVRMTCTFLRKKEADGVRRVVNQDGKAVVQAALGDPDGEPGLVLLTGYRSVATSLMLSKSVGELQARKRHVLLFDSRLYARDLVRGIVNHMNEDKLLLRALLKAIHPVAGALHKLAPKVGTAAAAIIHKLRGTPPLSLDALLNAFVEGCKAKGDAPVLVIDAADCILYAPDAEARQRVLGLLSVLTRVSEQQKALRIVLATSEHALLFRLRALGYDTGHISKTFVVGEVPPGVMHELLTQAWGCGPNLARMMLLMYGGHVMHASYAMCRLNETYRDRGALVGCAALGTCIGGPSECLSKVSFTDAGVPSKQHEEFRKRVETVLRALVTDGYVPLDSEEDKVAEVVSAAHVGFVAPVEAVAALLPPGALQALTPSGKPLKHVLVLGCHFMRLLIASETIW